MRRKLERGFHSAKVALPAKHQLRGPEPEHLDASGAPHQLLGEIRPHRDDGPDEAEAGAERDPPRPEAALPLGAPCPLGGEAEEPVAGQRESPGRKERSGERAPQDEEGRPGLSEPGPQVNPTRRAAPYERMVEGYEQVWYSIAAQRLIDFVPVTEPGWDSRPWHGDQVLITTGQIPTDA